MKRYREFRIKVRLCQARNEDEGTNKRARKIFRIELYRGEIVLIATDVVFIDGGPLNDYKARASVRMTVVVASKHGP